MRRSRYIAVLVLAGLVGVVAAVAIVAALSFRGLAPTAALSAAEKSLLVQVDDLIAFGIVPRQGRFTESFKAKRNLDRSRELEYAYEAADTESPFALRAEAEICATEKAAAASLKARVAAYRLGFRLAGKKGTELCDVPAPAGVGVETYMGQIRVGGRAAGCALVTRQDRTVFTVLLSGVYIDDAGDWAALLGPRLAKAGCVSLDTP